MSSSAALHAFSERFLADHFDAHPTYAAFLGFHEYDGRVPDLSRAAIGKRVAYLREALDDINGIESDQLEPVDWLDYQLLRDAIQFELFDLTEWRRWQIDPQTYLWPLGVDQYIKRNYAPLAERTQGLIQHLRHAPENAAGHHRLLGRGSASGSGGVEGAYSRSVRRIPKGAAHGIGC